MSFSRMFDNSPVENLNINQSKPCLAFELFQCQEDAATFWNLRDFHSNGIQIFIQMELI